MISILWLKKIIWVTGVLRRTVVSDWCFDNLCRSHLQNQILLTSHPCSKDLPQKPRERSWKRGWWLLHRFLKRQSLKATVLPRTPLTRTISFHKGISKFIIINTGYAKSVWCQPRSKQWDCMLIIQLVTKLAFPPHSRISFSKLQT